MPWAALCTDSRNQCSALFAHDGRGLAVSSQRRVVAGPAPLEAPAAGCRTARGLGLDRGSVPPTLCPATTAAAHHYPVVYSRHLARRPRRRRGGQASKCRRLSTIRWWCAATLTCENPRFATLPDLSSSAPQRLRPPFEHIFDADYLPAVRLPPAAPKKTAAAAALALNRLLYRSRITRKTL